MARILYGVMGDARGHLSRSTSIAQHMPEHEFLFVGGGTILSLRELGYEVVEQPMLATYYNDNRVDFTRTGGNALKLLLFRRNKIINRLAKVMDDFDPDLILTDYEYFTPQAAHKLGRQCVSMDHQHILSHFHYERPQGELVNRYMTLGTFRALYWNADRYFVSSFFELEPKIPRAEWFPPVLRKVVHDHSPSDGEHVVVYVSGGAYEALFPFLEQKPGKFIIYGFGEHPPRKNLVFKKPSIHGFLEDLASCRYVISNGGHNLISEALYYGKPILCYPIHFLYEQLMNGHFLAKYRYGEYTLHPVRDEKLIDTMEQNLDLYKQSIQRKFFNGNDVIAARLNELIASGEGRERR